MAKNRPFMTASFDCCLQLQTVHMHIQPSYHKALHPYIPSPLVCTYVHTYSVTSFMHSQLPFSLWLLLCKKSFMEAELKQKWLPSNPHRSTIGIKLKWFFIHHTVLAAAHKDCWLFLLQWTVDSYNDIHRPHLPFYRPSWHHNACDRVQLAAWWHLMKRCGSESLLDFHVQ